MNLSYAQMKTLADNYRKISKEEVDIINYLETTDGMFIGGYSDLAAILKKDNSNTRKSVLRLEKLGVINVKRADWVGIRSRMVACSLIPGWITAFLGEADSNGAK